MVFPALTYSRVLDEAKLDRLDVRREAITNDMFNSMKVSDHIMHSILAPQWQLEFDFRSQNVYSISISIFLKGQDMTRHCSIL
jgi:hypothetical protein